MALTIKERLLNNTAVTTPGQGQRVGKGGNYAFDVAGTFGGATVKLQRLASDGVTWLDVGSDASFTAAGHCLVSIPAGQYRAHVSGGSPSGLYSSLLPAF